MQKRKFLTIMMVAVSLSTADIVLADEAGSCHFHGKKIAKEETVSNCAADRKELLLWTARLTCPGRWLNRRRSSWQMEKKATNGWLSSLTPLLPIRPKGSFYLFFTAPGDFIAATLRASRTTSPSQCLGLFEQVALAVFIV